MSKHENNGRARILFCFVWVREQLRLDGQAEILMILRGSDARKICNILSDVICFTYPANIDWAFKEPQVMALHQEAVVAVLHCYINMQE